MRKLLIIVCLVLLGCSGIPRDFELSYGFGSCNRSWGWTSVAVDNKGNAKVVITPGEITRQYKVEDISSLVSEVYSQNFIALEPEYKNEFVEGGSCEVMQVRAAGTSHAVSIANTPVTEVQVITELLFELLNEQDENWWKP